MSGSALPASWTSFVGQERALGGLVELVSARRLVTLTGVGGAGKTRLALEVARRVESGHRDGVRMVALAGLRDGTLVPEAVVAATGLRDPPADRSVTEFLCASLAHRDVLLLIDNCEHVIAAVAELVCALLAACPNLSVLATSREPLCVPGEVERSAPLLDRPDSDAIVSPDRLHEYAAVRLLVERAADVRPDFSLTDDNVPSIARISAALDGIPLAIELVAARLRTLGPEEVAERLDAQLELLGQGGGRGRPDRQQTMRATLDWSHELLAADERAVLRRLSIFAGGFTLEAAMEVVEEGVSYADEAVESLVSKSLVEIERNRAAPRLRMLEPVRQYAAERLRDAEEYDAIAQRHGAWMVRFATAAGRSFMTEQDLAGPRLHDEQHNIRQALEVALAQGDGEAALRIAASLGYAWFTMGQPDARKWVARALETHAEVPPIIRGLALLGAGMLAESALDYDQARGHLREALEIALRTRSRRLEGWTLMALGRAAWAVDVEGRAAAAWFEDALRAFRQVEEPVGIAWMLTLLAEESFRAGDVELAASQAREAFEIGSRYRILSVLGDSQRILSCIAAARGDFVSAERILEDVAAACDQAGDRLLLNVTLCEKVGVVLDSGDTARALAPAREALRLARDVASRERTLHALRNSARALLGRGRSAEAATLVGAIEAASVELPNWATRFRDVSGSLSEADRPELAEHRLAGMELSGEQATELALRILDEEIAKTQPMEAERVQLADQPSARVVERPERFRRDGDFWTIVFADKEIRLRDLRGLHYLATLLREPGREFHATDLVRSGSGPTFAPPLDDTLAIAPGTGDAGERLDSHARAAYRARLADIEDELADAERINDRGRLEHAREEREELIAELGAAARGKRASSDAERARLAATKGIKAALDKIAASHPELGAHLHATVRRGYFCSYVPDPRHPIEWET